MADEQPEMIPLVEEQATVSTEQRITGRIRVTTHTETAESMIPLELSQADVEVTRVPVDREIDHAPEVVTKGDLTIIPVVEERLVVTRQLFLREEIHIRRTERSEVVEVPVTTRKQTATIERIPVDDE